jgi:hypothetical protein
MLHLYGLIRHNKTLTILANIKASSVFLTDSTDREKTVLQENFVQILWTDGEHGERANEDGQEAGGTGGGGHGW